MLETLGRVETSFRTAVLPWARTLPGDPGARGRSAGAMRAIIKGYVVQLAVLDRSSADQYLDDLAGVLAAAL